MVNSLKPLFQGSMVALVTPMQSEGEQDYPALERLLDFHLAQETDAIVIAGTTGEASTLRIDEHCELIQRTVQYVQHRIPVIAGTGSNSTPEAIELTQCAQAVGADACLLVTPYYNKPTQKGLYLHHKAVAEAVAIPQILYNVPGRTGCDLRPETIIQLSSIENIIGVKEATGDLGRLQALRGQVRADFGLYSGDDATAMEFMLQGGHGVISVTANVVPKAMHQLCQAACAQLREEAARINQRIAAWHQALFVESNPIPVKWVLAQMGYIQPGIRLPLTWLDEAFHAELAQLLTTIDNDAGGLI